MESPDPELRIMTSQQWGELANPGAIPTLKTALVDTNRYVRIAAAESLQRLGDSSWQTTLEAIVAERGPELKPGKRPGPAEELKSIARSKLRVAAIRVYALAKTPEAEAKLRELRDDPDAAVRDAARVGLARLGSQEDFDKFAGALDSQDPAERLTAVRRLGDIGSNIVSQALQKTAKDPDAQVRAATMSAMGATDDPTVIPYLSQGIDDKDPFVRSNAVEALSRLALPQSKTHLKLAYEKAPTAIQKLLAERGLAKMGEKVELALAGRSVAQKDLDTRLIAVEVLEAAESAEAMDILQLVLDDSNSRVKARAAAAILKRLKRAPPPAPAKGGKK